MSSRYFICTSIEENRRVHSCLLLFRNAPLFLFLDIYSIGDSESRLHSNTGLCKKNSCKNGGCCAVLSETHFQCLCARGFKGTSCEEAVSTLEEIAITLSNSYVTTVIAICSLVAAAFLYLSGKAVRRHRKRRRARYSRQLKAPKEPKTLSTETNL
ncbi:Pikachurin [Trichinella sp. T9]|nr:Pikachurin [Trichinella sp. T9]